MKKLLPILSLILSCSFMQTPTLAVRIKLATKAPENFETSQIFKKLIDEIKQQTNGEVEFKVYYGGVKGTGRDLFLKMKSGEIQGGEFTAGEASLVYKDLVVLSFPLIFKTYDEISYVMEKLTPRFQQELRQQGYEVLGWLETGFAQIMSVDPITSLEDLKGKKVWIPEGDAIGRAAFQAMGVSPIPMTIADVMVALQTGQLNTVANSYVGGVALQWHTAVRYITDNPLLYVFGLVMITNEAYSQIPEQYKPVVRETFAKYFTLLRDDMRRHNTASSETLKKQGLTFVTMKPEDLVKIDQVMNGLKGELANKEFSREVLDAMTAALTEYRNANP